MLHLFRNAEVYAPEPLGHQCDRLVTRIRSVAT